MARNICSEPWDCSYYPSRGTRVFIDTMKKQIFLRQYLRFPQIAKIFLLLTEFKDFSLSELVNWMGFFGAPSSDLQSLRIVVTPRPTVANSVIFNFSAVSEAETFYEFFYSGHLFREDKPELAVLYFLSEIIQLLERVLILEILKSLDCSFQDSLLVQKSQIPASVDFLRQVHLKLWLIYTVTKKKDDQNVKFTVQCVNLQDSLFILLVIGVQHIQKGRKNDREESLIVFGYAQSVGTWVAQYTKKLILWSIQKHLYIPSPQIWNLDEFRIISEIATFTSFP